MTTVIYARDFNSDTTDPNRHVWTGPALQAVSDALQGRKVALENDPQTGNVSMGMVLDGMRGDRLLVQGYTDVGVLFGLRSIGMILPIEDKATDSTKWKALDLYRERKSAASKAAWEFLQERDGRNWGNLKVQGANDGFGFIVNYEPHAFAPAGHKTGSKASLLVRKRDNGDEWYVARVLADWTDLDRRTADREAARQERAAS